MSRSRLPNHTLPGYPVPRSQAFQTEGALRIVARVTTVPPATVPEVIARLEAIQAASPRSDGVACFARLYCDVTRGVDAELARSSFADQGFLERLDIVFANLFFDA